METGLAADGAVEIRRAGATSARATSSWSGGDRTRAAAPPGAADDAVPAIELRDVTRSFPGPPEVQALKGVNLNVPDGDYLSIIGPSGSGKSTMLNLLGLLDRPTVGEYRLGGVLTSTSPRTSGPRCGPASWASSSRPST